MAALGHGVALARTSFVEDMIESGRLVAPFSYRLRAKDNVSLVHVIGLHPKSPAAMFRDWLISEARTTKSKKSARRK
jgi:LysR family glycine cleavage system transcriptional activator